MPSKTRLNLLQSAFPDPLEGAKISAQEDKNLLVGHKAVLSDFGWTRTHF